MCMIPMIPTNHYSVSSTMPLDHDEDQSYKLFSTNYQASSATSSDLLYPQASYSNSSILIPTLLQSGQGSYHQEPNHLGSDEEAEKVIPSSGSWDHVGVESRSKLKVKLGNENLEAEDGSVKWMSPKMRIMHKFEQQKQQLLSPLGNDNNTNSSNHSNTTVRFCSSNFKQQFSLQGSSDNSGNNSSNNNNITVRVCSDCHTTKTPLWRSGPRGPKTLCNACGIRQRKARRAMAAAAAAAAASAGGTILTAAEPTHVKGRNLQNKEKKTKIKVASQKKKKAKHGCKPCKGRKKFSFEDLRISLSKNLALQQVFPQDEKEAAIMLMALSYGLLHGFPSDSYLD